MGTYTTNYQLYMPTVGENGWGTLINGNYQTIDATMKGLSNRITAVENEVNGALSCTSITTSGKITGNGGIAGTTGTFSEMVTSKNVNKFGLIPITLVLSTIERNTDLIDIPKPGLLEKSLNAGNYSSYSLFYSSRGITTGYKSKVLFTAKNDSLFFAINDIKVDGNWSYKLVSGHADVTFKVTTRSGSVISSITNSGKSITFAQAKDILTDIITVEGTYSGEYAYQNASIFLHVTNNSNNVQYVYTTWGGLE